MPTLLERIGNEKALTKVINRFYALMLDDDRISFLFEGVSIESLERKQVWFFTSLLVGDCDGTFSYMRSAHQHLVKSKGLNAGHFDASIECLSEAMRISGVDKKSSEEILITAQNLKPYVLGEK